MNEDNNLWIHKYKPITMSDLISNKYGIQRIKTWLDEFENNKKIKDGETKGLNGKSKVKNKKKNNPKSSLIVIGNHGVGKTISVEVLLRSMGYDIQRINFENVKITKDVDSFIDKFLSNSDVLGMINDKKTRKFAVVVDEIETISSNTEKTFILALQRKNNADWNFPLIIVSNNKHSKLLSDIRKECLEVPFRNPTKDDMKHVLIKICRNENLKIKDTETMNLLIDHAQDDIRRLIYILQDLNYEYNKDVTIGRDEFQKYLLSSKTKDSNDDIYTATEELFTKFNSIDDALRWYETDKVLTPLMIHSNFIDQIILNDALNETDKVKVIQLNQASEIAEMLSFGDVVENYIYGDQNWDMHDIHGFFSCIGPSHILSNGSQVTKNNDNTYVKRRIKDLQLEFNKFNAELDKNKKKDLKTLKYTELLFESIRYFKTKTWLYKFLRVYDKRRDKINELIDELIKRIEILEDRTDPSALLEFLHSVYSGLCETIKKQYLRSPVHSNMEFPIDLNKTSIKNINKRNINNANKAFSKMGIEDYIYMNRIVRKLVDDNRIKECAELFKGYNATLEPIEALLKIDKIAQVKSVLTNKQKKEFTNYLEGNTK